MSLALNVDFPPTSVVRIRAARAVPAIHNSQPVFVDPSGRRGRRCRVLLGAAAAVALFVVVTLAALTMTLVRSAAPQADGGPLAPAQRPAATLPVGVTDAPTDARR
jgi:hypothetical protein